MTVDGLATVFRFDAVTLAMVSLVGLVTAVLLPYSASYLGREPGYPRFRLWLLATVGAVLLVVTTNHLVVAVAAWAAASLALHQLLTFYPERRAARLAAHKKFLVSRLADACFVGALVALAQDPARLTYDGLERAATSAGSGALSLQLAAVLLVAGVCLRTAQLPFHGWLLQVMEAPTPVSALLHAGVVNLGGYLLIRVSGLLSASPVASALLVLVGTATAVVGSLVMMTAPSIKAKLAWSTSAQMGFMLVQCGLGAPELALLHLLAHSLYKAHAFLTTGGTVDRWQIHASAPHVAAPSVAATLGGAALGLALVGAALVALGIDLADEPALAAFAFVLGVAHGPYLSAAASRGLGAAARGGAWVLVTVGLYFLWHEAFARLVPSAPPATLAVQGPLVAWVIAAFAALLVVQATLRAHPRGALARRLVPALQAGLYLDQRFTRWALSFWPAPKPTPPVAADARAEAPLTLQPSSLP